MVDSVQIFPPGFRVANTSGTPVSGAIIYIYEAGTTTEKAVYSDVNLTSSLGGIVYTDSAGYPVTAYGGSTKTLVYGDTDLYKVLITDSSGATLASHDNVKGAVISSAGAGASGITQDQADVRYVRNPNALAAETTIADTDLPSFWDVSATANKGITFANWVTATVAKIQSAGLSEFPAGTRLLFQQTTPPTGWTKESSATYDNAALRFVTGTVGTGGTAAFTTAFASRTPAGTVGATTLATANIPAHTHSTDTTVASIANGTGSAANNAHNSAGVTGSTGSGTSHTHGFTGTAMDFAVKYADCCIAQKN